MNYGFECACRLCTFERRVQPVPTPPARDAAELAPLEATLRSFSLGDITQEVRVPTAPGSFERLPKELLPVLHESYLPSLSEAFSKTSHEGPYAEAIDRGLTLLAFYVMLYPPNYPQIGKRLYGEWTHELERSTDVTLLNRYACTGASQDPLELHLHRC